MISGAQLDDVAKGLMRQLKDHFGSAAVDFVLNRSQASPFVEMEMEFSAYQYLLVVITVERSTVFFGVRSGKVIFPIMPPIELPVSGEAPDFRLADAVLLMLESQLRLRIPDKFLMAKGWT